MTEKRTRHFRGVKVELECGHTAVLSSSFWRLSEEHVAAIVNHAVRGGTFCMDDSHQVKPRCMVTRVIGTVRL